MLFLAKYICGGWLEGGQRHDCRQQSGLSPAYYSSLITNTRHMACWLPVCRGKSLKNQLSFGNQTC
jgi:hypothetical protein